MRGGGGRKTGGRNKEDGEEEEEGGGDWRDNGERSKRVEIDRDGREKGKGGL